MVLYKLNVTKLIDIFEKFVDTEIKGLILHSFDAAKFAASLSSIFNLDRTKAYLLGLLHDFGLIIYSRLAREEKLLDELNNVTKNGRYSFKLDSFVRKLDKSNTHSMISYTLAKSVGLFREEELMGLLHHHGVSEKIGDEAKLWAEILIISDKTVQTFRTEISKGMVEALKSTIDVIETSEVSNVVKSAAKDVLRDINTSVMIFDERPYIEEFIDTDIEINFTQLLQFLKILVMFVDFRSPYTRKHTLNISELSYDLCQKLCRTYPDSLTLYAAGLIHDFGKIRTPLSILHKPGKLDEVEYHIMKMHISDTYRIFKNVNELSEIVQIAVYHHERLDGSGYPFGLTEDELPMKARILQVADVFVALTEERPYRKAMSYDEALNVIKKQVEMGKLDEDVYKALS